MLYVIKKDIVLRHTCGISQTVAVVREILPFLDINIIMCI